MEVQEGVLVWNRGKVLVRVFLCIKGLGYQEARLANICSCVAGAHCDEVDENPEASRQQAVAHQYRVKIPFGSGFRNRAQVFGALEPRLIMLAHF